MATDLVERGESMATLERCFAAAAVDGGRIALVAGEAGIGKTSVLRAFARTRPDETVWWGACDALQTPHPLAPLLDIARERRPRFAAALDGPRAALFEAVLDELRLTAQPMLVVVEDAHWADDATLDWLKHLGRRIERTRALLAVSYRDDEVTATHPLRRVLGELPVGARPLLAVPRLSPAAVETLARRAGRRADGVHAATRGNAFFVTELLRDASDPRPAVPASVQDLVLARFARLSAGAQALLRAVSVAPGRAERWLIEHVAAPSLADTEAALGSGLLVTDGDSFTYRHELGRVAIESTLSPPAARALHARVLAALCARGSIPPARLVHHALRCGDTEALTRWAPQAAREAAQRGAWREQGAQWRIALQHGTPRDEDERLEWLDSFAGAASVNGWSDEQLQALREIETRSRARGDTLRAALNLARQFSPLTAQLKHPQASAVLHEALAQIEPLPPSATHAAIWALESHLRMLDRDYDDSVRWGRRALALAESLGEQATIERVQNGMGAALLFVDYQAGRAMLHALIDRRRADGRQVPLANALAMIGSGAGELMHLQDAEGYLRESIALAEANDVEHGYPSAWLALCLMLRGRWDEATGVATEVLAQGAEDISNVMAWLALARERLRRGDPGADEALDAALRLAQGSQTLQRVAPTACARAEAAFTRDDPAALRSEVQRALPLARAKGHPWFVGELSWWLWRAGALDQTVPCGCAEPYALQIGGRWREAADAWQALGCPFERARALAEGDECAQREALEVFEGLGARPAAEALRQRLREAGVRGVARGARASTREHAFGLTTRELEVLRLLCDGLRNADIAERLHRSVRTVDHHLEAVFAKLGVDSRVAAIQAAQHAGLAPRTGRPGKQGSKP
jgi:DNA-binding CsgD family transcriptional regulator/tetratricopeptide (TPR) repeat protein